MFCMQCGTQLPDEAKFCFMCGTPIGGTKDTATETKVAGPSAAGTKLVDAKCTNCGAKLEVDPNMKKASCSFCGAEFIVDQAINNYNVQMNGSMNIGEATINVQGVDKENLLKRAKDFEENNKFDEALDYYNRVLDIDYQDADAKVGAERVQEKIKNFYYLDEEVFAFFGNNHRKRLTRESLILVDGDGRTTTYYFSRMKNITASGGSLLFEYEGRGDKVKVGGYRNDEIYNFILNAQRGIIPPFQKL